MLSIEACTGDGYAGVHGTYYKLSPHVGIKLIHSKVYPSVKRALASRAFRLASDEAAILVHAEETGVVPKCYGVTVVSVKSGFRVGVLMQHLGQTTLADTEHYDDADIYDQLMESLEEVGIYHGDLHEDNIMVYRGKFYAVDFSPESVTVK